MIAFWKYDQYPFCLSGEITETKPNGSVITKEFGREYAFMPLVVLPDEVGVELQTKLGDLRTEYRAQMESLRKQYIKKAQSVAPFLKGGAT